MPTDLTIADTDLCADAAASYAAVPTLVADDCRIVLSKRAGVTIVAIPGTRPDRIRDWITDLRAFPHTSREHPEVGSCHSGCLDGAEAMLPGLLDALGGAPYAVTGHSLGGGFALPLVAMVAARGYPPVRLTTFGGMTVCKGPQLPALLAKVPGERYWNGNDPVPELPPWLGIDRGHTPIGIARLDPIACHLISAYLADIPR